MRHQSCHKESTSERVLVRYHFLIYFHEKRKGGSLHGVAFVGNVLDRETMRGGEGERCMIVEAGLSIVVVWCYLVVLGLVGLIERERGMLVRSCAIPERNKINDK